uniref:Uncharacterized protein n=1 Tax=Tetranychus urticae TaxID=32264 RepID=T1KWL1_TETUR
MIHVSSNWKDSIKKPKDTSLI